MATETTTAKTAKAAGVIVKDADFRAMAGIRKAMGLVAPGSPDYAAVVEWFNRTYPARPATGGGT